MREVYQTMASVSFRFFIFSIMKDMFLLVYHKPGTALHHLC